MEEGEESSSKRFHLFSVWRCEEEKEEMSGGRKERKEEEEPQKAARMGREKGKGRIAWDLSLSEKSVSQSRSPKRVFWVWGIFPLASYEN